MCVGDSSAVGTPGPIPNPAVKHRSADDNAFERGCESRLSPTHSIRTNKTKMNQPLLELTDIFKIYNQGRDNELEVLKDVNITLQKGDFAALIGPSGSGKSTLMHIIGLLDRPTAGHYRLDGRDVAHLRDRAAAKIRREEIGFVFQNFNLLPRTTALANVLMPTIYSHIKGSRAKAIELLKTVGLGERIHANVDNLSGGEKQRVAIARALINDPNIILADEPTGNLDSKTGASIIDLLEALNKKGVTVLFVTHDLGIVKRTKTVYKIQDGQIVDGKE